MSSFFFHEFFTWTVISTVRSHVTGATVIFAFSLQDLNIFPFQSILICRFYWLVSTDWLYYGLIWNVQVKESKWLVKCFLNYLRHDKSEVGALFDMLSIFLFHSRIDYTFLKEFYIIEVNFVLLIYKFTLPFHIIIVFMSWMSFVAYIGIQVAEGYAPNLKKTILLYFLNIFQSKQFGQDHLVVAMQILILPMLAHTFQNGQSWEVVDPSIIKTIVDKLLDPPEEVVYNITFYVS